MRQSSAAGALDRPALGLQQRHQTFDVVALHLDDAARAARRIMTDDGFNIGVLYAGDRKAYAAPRNAAPCAVADLAAEFEL